MKGLILTTLLFLGLQCTLSAQVFCKDSTCIDTVNNGLNLLSKVQSGSNCQFTIEFCFRKSRGEADSVDFSIFHTNGVVKESISIDTFQEGAVICRLFSFTAHCNSSASVYVVSTESNNDICGIISDLIILPIRLLDFQAQLQRDGNVLLNWQTASESNASHFIVQQSSDGRVFTDVGVVKAAGESNSLKSYALFASQNSTTNSDKPVYYRLMMTDLDGKFAYSKVISVRDNKRKNFEAYPNPVQHTLRINAFDLQTSQVKIFNTQGVECQFNWISDDAIDLSQLHSGLYIIQYQDTFVRLIKE